MYAQGVQRLSQFYLDPTSTTIMVPSYPDHIIFTHALKVVNPLSGCLFPIVRKRDYDRAATPGLGERQVLFLVMYIGILLFGHSLSRETFPKCAQFPCIKLTADHDITYIFLPKKAKEQPAACSTHISQQAVLPCFMASVPHSWIPLGSHRKGWKDTQNGSSVDMGDSLLY